MAVPVVVLSSTRPNCALCGSGGRVLMRGVNQLHDDARDIPCPHCNPPHHPLVYLPQQAEKDRS